MSAIGRNPTRSLTHTQDFALDGHGVVGGRVSSGINPLYFKYLQDKPT